MGFSGYAAQGAQQNLEQLFAAQLKEELEREEMARLQEEREAQRALREQDLSMRRDEMAQRMSIADREETRHAATAKATADKEAHKMTALRGISEFINTPGMENVAREHAVASGVDLPSYIEKKLDPKPLADLVPVTIPNPNGKGGLQVMMRKDDPRYIAGLPTYKEPTQATPEGKQWLIRPGEKNEVYDYYKPGDTRSAAPSAGGGGGDRLSATLVEKVAGYEAAAESLRQVGEMLPSMKGHIGPLAGPLTAGQQMLPGASKEVATFNAKLATLRNTMIKAITGAAMSEPEAARIMAELPSENQQPEVFEARMESTMANLKYVRKRIYELSNMPEPAMGRSGGGGGAPAVGDVVTVNGQRVRITGFGANGKAKGVPVP